MTPLDSRIDEDFVCRLYRGEPLVLEGQLENKDGAVEDLTGRTFWACIMAADGSVLHEVVAEIHTDRSGAHYRCTFDGTMSTTRFGERGLIWSQGESVASLGRKIHAQGALIIYPGPGMETPSGDNGIAAFAHRIVRRESLSKRDMIRISQMGERGVPGQAPWEAEGQTYDEWKAAQIEAPVATATSAALTAAQATAQIGADVRAEADAKLGEVDAALGPVPAAVSAANIAAANAQAKADLAETTRLAIEDQRDELLAVLPQAQDTLSQTRTARDQAAASAAQASTLVQRKEFTLFTRVGRLGSTGNLNVDANWAATELIDVSLIDIVSLTLVGDPAVSTIAFYDVQRVFLSKVSAAATNGLVNVYPAPPAGAAFVAFTRAVSLPAVDLSVQRFDFNTAYRSLPSAQERATNASREAKAFAPFTRTGYVTLAGGFTGDINWCSTELIELAYIKSFDVRLRGHPSVASVAYWDANKVLLATIAAPSASAYISVTPASFAAPAGAVYISFTSNRQADERFWYALAPAALPPRRVIEGRFPVEIAQMATIAGSYYSKTNAIVNDANWRRSGFVTAKAGDQFDMTLFGHPNVAALLFYDVNKALIGFFAPSVSSAGAMFSTVQTAPAGTAFVRLSFGDPEKIANATASIGQLVSVANLYLQAQSTAAPTMVPLLAPFRAPRKIPFTAGMKNLLYGDSRSSTDYTWYKTQMEALTGASWYNGGFSGQSVASNASDASMQRIFDYGAQGAIVLLPGGNDTGAAGSVGTFNGSVADEPPVSPVDYAATYTGTTFIQAVDYQIGRIKRGYENIRARAALTGAETEAEKNDKIRALIKPMIVLLTDLPQQRTNAANAFSLPENWRRKRDAIVEVGHRHKVHTIDTMYELSLDMSLEPFFVAPTDKVTNNGVFTMDGLHLNEFGYERLTRRLAADIM